MYKRQAQRRVGGKYNEAVALMRAGNTAQTAMFFSFTDNYKDTAEQSMAL